MQVGSHPFLRSAHLAASVTIALVIVAATVPAFFRIVAEEKIPDDFHVVYLGARAMIDHAEIHAATNGMYIYSPFLAFVFQPLALLPERIAALIWLFMIASIIVTATIIAARKIAETWQLSAQGYDGSIFFLVSAGALLLSFEKIRSEFRLGQTDCLILLGLSLILVWLDRRPGLAAIVVGLCANFKYLALIFVPYFVVKRNYRAAITSTVAFTFFFVLPSAETGGRLLGDYTANAVAVLEKVIGGPGFAKIELGGRAPVVNSVAWTNSVSFTSAVFRLTESLQLSNTVAGIVIALLFVAIVAVLIWIGHRYDVYLLRPITVKVQIARAKVTIIEWAVLIGLALIFGPQTTARHMIMLTLVYLVGITLVLVEHRSTLRVLLFVSMILTAVTLSLPFRETGAHPALLALKSAGAASWCALALIFSIAVIGSRNAQTVESS